MHRPEIKVEREVNILCNKPSQQSSSKLMHRIKWRICQIILCLPLVPSVELIRGIQMEEMSKLGWLIGLVMNAI
jgi:hypothetical protein